MLAARFENKTIIVTGGGSGIGRAIVARLVAEGGRVLAVDLHQSTLDESCAAANEYAVHGGKASSIAASVTDEQAVMALVRDFADNEGKLDVMINMAGILRSDHATELTLAHFRNVLEVNLLGTFLFCREALPYLEKSGGNIVNCASTSSFFGTAYSAAYAASKGGVAALTQTLAWEYMLRGVRVNAVAPGGIATPMTMGHSGNLPDNVDPTLFAHLLRPDMRFGDPADVAGAVAMLASEDGRNINAVVLRVDGGVHG